jgi:predicted GH43/DUF377 family glycosyl hydrolase
MQPEDKDAALLPHRIGGRWALIHRPVSFRGQICGFLLVCLRHWGDSQNDARIPAGWLVDAKIGLSPPPIET